MGLKLLQNTIGFTPLIISANSVKRLKFNMICLKSSLAYTGNLSNCIHVTKQNTDTVATPANNDNKSTSGIATKRNHDGHD